MDVGEFQKDVGVGVENELWGPLHHDELQELNGLQHDLDVFLLKDLVGRGDNEFNELAQVHLIQAVVAPAQHLQHFEPMEDALAVLSMPHLSHYSCYYRLGLEIQSFGRDRT